MAFDRVFHGPPVEEAAPGTKQSPSFGVDVTNKELYISSGNGWEELNSPSGGVSIQGHSSFGEGSAPDNVPTDWLSDTGPTEAIITVEESSTSPDGLAGIYIKSDWSPSSNVDPDFFANYGLGVNTALNADGQATDNLYQAGIAVQVTNLSNTRVQVVEGEIITVANANGGTLDEQNGISPYVTNDGAGFVEGMCGVKCQVLNTGAGHIEFMEGYYSRMSVLAGSVRNAWAFESTGDDSVMSGGTLENYAGFHYSTPHPTAGGTVITNNYGMYLDAAAHATNNWQIYSNGTAESYFKGPITAPYTKAQIVYSNAGTALPSAVTAGVGARAFVSDANSAAFAAAYVGGGTNKVPVWSDGTAWKIG